MSPKAGGGGNGYDTLTSPMATTRGAHAGKLAKGGRVLNQVQVGYSHSASPTAGRGREGSPLNSARPSNRSKATFADHYAAAVYTARSHASDSGYTGRSSARKPAQRMAIENPETGARNSEVLGDSLDHSNTARKMLRSMTGAFTTTDGVEPPEPGTYDKGSAGKYVSKVGDSTGYDDDEQDTNIYGKKGNMPKGKDMNRKLNQQALSLSGTERYPDPPDLNIFLPLERYEEVHPLEPIHNKGPNCNFDLDLESEINFAQWGFRVGNPYVFKGSALKDSLLITEIYVDSPLSEWNMQHISEKRGPLAQKRAERQIKRFSRIVSVNGITKDLPRMLKTISMVSRDLKLGIVNSAFVQAYTRAAPPAAVDLDGSGGGGSGATGHLALEENGRETQLMILDANESSGINTNPKFYRILADSGDTSIYGKKIEDVESPKMSGMGQAVSSSKADPGGAKERERTRDRERRGDIKDRDRERDRDRGRDRERERRRGGEGDKDKEGTKDKDLRDKDRDRERERERRRRSEDPAESGTGEGSRERTRRRASADRDRERERGRDRERRKESVETGGGLESGASGAEGGGDRSRSRTRGRDRDRERRGGDRGERGERGGDRDRERERRANRDSEDGGEGPAKSRERDRDRDRERRRKDKSEATQDPNNENMLENSLGVPIGNQQKDKDKSRDRNRDRDRDRRKEGGGTNGDNEDRHRSRTRDRDRGSGTEPKKDKDRTRDRDRDRNLKPGKNQNQNQDDTPSENPSETLGGTRINVGNMPTSNQIRKGEGGGGQYKW